MPLDAEFPDWPGSAADLRALAAALERAAEALQAVAREAERTARPSTQAASRASPDTRLLTVAEAAALLSLSRSKVYSHVLSGDIPTITVGRSRRIATTALASWIARQQSARR